jgi:hypothetical protein
LCRATAQRCAHCSVTAAWRHRSSSCCWSFTCHVRKASGRVSGEGERGEVGRGETR